MTQSPTIGRIVHYVLENNQHRAALIVNAWDTPSDHPDHCSLMVYLDAANDLEVHLDETRGVQRIYVKNGIQPVNSSDLNNGMLNASSVPQDELTRRPGTWHWPERV